MGETRRKFDQEFRVGAVRLALMRFSRRPDGVEAVSRQRPGARP